MNKDELNKLYIENIKRIRTEKKLSQEKLAELSNLSSPFISDIENGKKWGSFETLVSIANALEVEPYELLLPPKTNVSYDTKRTQELMKRLRSNFSELVDTMEEFLKK
ncbi:MULTISPECIES: helix-turn-helix domain-containing protein [unclassified Treponema]|uniref:helix-turn-helix domain-containing protein n=1 Tax=unclassified Treponema TaxID=2638727 RepID=UPI0025F8A880|nr:MULTISPECIES: helix-turn-helix transcriptional regulator [unclassified Treponema]